MSVTTKKVGFIYESDLTSIICRTLPIARKSTEQEDLLEGTDIILSSGKEQIRIDLSLRRKTDVSWLGEVILGGIPHLIGVKKGNRWIKFQEEVFVVCPAITNELDRLIEQITEDEIYDFVDYLCELKEVRT